jgi:hypothetical protein
MSISKLSVLACGAWVLCGCGSSEAPAAQPPPPAQQPGDDAGVRALFGPRETTPLTPFPSDRYASADSTSSTGLRVALSSQTTSDPLVKWDARTIAQLDQLDGFSTAGGAWASFDGALDEASVVRAVDAYRGPDAPLLLLDVDAGSPERGKPVDLVVRCLSTTSDDGSARDHTVLAQPARPLRPKTRYLFVVTDRTKGADGKPVRPTAEMRALIGGSDASSYAGAVRAALAVLESSAQIPASRVALASLFTTSSATDAMAAMASARRASAPPSAVGAATLDKQETAPDDRRVRFAGKLTAPELRRSKPDGTWELVGGVPKVQSTATLEYYLVFSNQDHSGPRPVVVFAHGMGGDKESTWGPAKRLAELDVAVIGIDAPEHGSRATPPYPPGQTDTVKASLELLAIDPGAKTFDVARARDNFGQAISDELELVRFVQTLAGLDVLPVGAPDGVPDLDTSRILFLGHSFGASFGPALGAVAPEVLAACWNVAGGALMTMMRDSGTFKLLAGAARPAGASEVDIARWYALIQGIIDPSDPVTFGRFATLEPLPGVTGWRGADVLLQQVKDDAIVPNVATEMLARAAGLAQVGPPAKPIGGTTLLPAPVSGNLPGGGTGGVFVFDVADGKKAEHGTLISSTEGRAQYVELFRSALAGGRARIIDPIARP